ncbi:repressor LexA [Candidatus Peregrinibacteria bacterium]|nr:MAG: repressor LexA [Candidatus Peregrinibacteria bacterium]
MNSLTKKQQLVLHVIEAYQSRGDSPSLSELQTELKKKGLELKSRRSVAQYLEALEKKGLIKKSSEERSIQLVKTQSSEDFFSVPLYGAANAGAALVFAEDNIKGFLKISKKLLKTVENVFALEIAGDSMNDCKIDNDYIEDGDYVVINKSVQDYRNNDVILAIIDGCATVKKLKKSLFGEVVLTPQSSNPVHQPIYIHESDSFFFNGRVVQVLKSPKNI